MRRLRLVIYLVTMSAGQSGVVAAQPSPDRASLPVARMRDESTAFSAYTGVSDSLRGVIRDSTTWRRLWARINQPFIPQPPLPTIDFRREMIVVAALGRRPSAGYDVVIESAEQDSTGIEVALRRGNPTPGCPVAAVVTQPLDLARIPASEQPVRFRERSVTVPCGSR